MRTSLYIRIARARQHESIIYDVWRTQIRGLVLVLVLVSVLL